MFTVERIVVKCLFPLSLLMLEKEGGSLHLREPALWGHDSVSSWLHTSVLWYLLYVESKISDKPAETPPQLSAACPELLLENCRVVGGRGGKLQLAVQSSSRQAAESSTVGEVPACSGGAPGSHLKLPSLFP